MLGLQREPIFVGSPQSMIAAGGFGRVDRVTVDLDAGQLQTGRLYQQQQIGW